MLTNLISLSSGYNGAPGGGWTAEVEFRPLKRGFSIWQRLSSFDGEPFRFRRVGGAKQPLAWRRIVDCLRSPAIEGLSGFDLIDSIEVTGIPSGWMSELCAIAWIQFENDFDPLLERLLTLSEDEIAIYYALIGPFADEGVLSRLEELEDALQPVSLARGSLDRIQHEIGWIPGMDWEDLVDSAQNLGLIYALATDAGLQTSSLAEITASIGLDERSSFEQRITSLKELADAAERRAQDTRDLMLIATLSGGAGENQWSNDFFETCFDLQGRFPKQFANKALRDWCDLTDKPVARNSRPDIEPKLEILSWIFSSCSEDWISEFAEKHPDEFNRIVAWLDALLVEQTNELARCKAMPGGFVSGPHRSAAIVRAQALIDSTTRTIEALSRPIRLK